MRRIMLWTVLATVALGAFWLSQVWAAPESLVGKAAPPIKLKLLDGGDFDASAVKADVVLVDFWATWCPPCRLSLPKIQAIADWAQKENKSVAVYIVNLREPAATVKKFVQDNKLTVPVPMDASGAVATSYQVEGIPTTVLLSKGKVAAVHVGYSDKLEEELKADIEKALKATK